MRTVAITEAELVLSSLIDQVASEPLAIERNGEPVAFIVSPAEYATTRAARGMAAVDALNRVHGEIEARIDAGEFTPVELETFVRAFASKAS